MGNELDDILAELDAIQALQAENGDVKGMLMYLTGYTGDEIDALGGVA